jgi:hypothetical protein
MIQLPLLSKGVEVAKTCKISIFEHHCLPILEKQNVKSVQNDFDMYKHFLLFAHSASIECLIGSLEVRNQSRKSSTLTHFHVFFVV